ncbi:MAG: hypothetical protein ACYC1M_11980 [Armatimonadota bacterium]
MAVHNGRKQTVVTRSAQVLPRTRMLGPRNKGIIYDLLGPSVASLSVSISVDVRLSVVRALSVVADCGVLVVGTRELIADTAVCITGAVQSDYDAMVRVNRPLVTDGDISLQVNGFLACDCDSMVAVSSLVDFFCDMSARISSAFQIDVDTLLQATRTGLTNVDLATSDSAQRISGQLIQHCDEEVVISSVYECLADVCARVSDSVHSDAGAYITVWNALTITADELLDITDAGLASADMVMVVTRIFQISVDTSIHVIHRQAPDSDCGLVIYSLLICEEHSIRV